MNFTEDNLNNRRTPGKSNLLIALILFAITLTAAFVVYLQSEDVSLSLDGLKKVIGTSGEVRSVSGPEIKQAKAVLDLPDECRTAACVYKNMIVKCTDEGVQFFDKSGNAVKELDMNFTTPMLKTNGMDLLAADIGGKYLYIIDGTEIKWEKEADGEIINADIGKNGVVTVVEDSGEYRNRVSVYDSYGTEKFYRNIASNRVISAEVSPGDEQLALLILDTSDVFANPCLEYLDMNGKLSASKVPAKGQIFTLVRWFEDDSLITANDTTLVFYDKEKQEAWRRQFNEITSITGVPGRITVAAYKNKQGLYGSGTVIGYFNSKGQQKIGCELEDDIGCLRSYNSIIAAISTRKAYFLNTSGRVIGEYTAKSDITDILFFSKTEAAIVTRSNIIIVKI